MSCTPFRSRAAVIAALLGAVALAGCRRSVPTTGSKGEVRMAYESYRLHNGLEGFLVDQPDFARSLAVQREVVENERRQRMTEVAYGGVDAVAAAALFGVTHPYGHDPIGPSAEVAAVSEADARSFFTRHYAPDNA